MVREEIIKVVNLQNNLLSLKDLLDNRKQRILSTIRNSEELRRGTIEQLEKARIRLQKVELEADEYRMNGYSEIESSIEIREFCLALFGSSSLTSQSMHNSISWSAESAFEIQIRGRYSYSLARHL